MATFQAQVTGLTGITISSSGTIPTEAQLTQFLIDGVLDVTSKSIKADPRSAIDFQRESVTTDTQGFDTAGAQVLSVMREADASGDSDGTTVWEPCRLVPAVMQSIVVQTDSLSFASIYNPVYIIDDDGLISVYPIPQSNDGYRVLYVNNVPTDETNDASVTYAHSDLKYFPQDKVPSVALYAAIRSLETAAASKIAAQDIELQQAYLQLAASFKAEYVVGFQVQQPQGAQPRR